MIKKEDKWSTKLSYFERVKTYPLRKVAAFCNNLKREIRHKHFEMERVFIFFAIYDFTD